MNILVTGGAGFIGSHLVDALLARGNRVVVYDNLEKQVHGKVEQKPLYVNQEAQFVEADIRDYDMLRKVILSEKIEVVFHQAAAVGIGQSMYEIRRYVDVNTLGGANILDIVASSNHYIEKIIVASSMSIYGEGRYECDVDGNVYPKLRADGQLARHDWEMKCPCCGRNVRPVATDEEKPLMPTSIYASTKRDHEEMFLQVGQAYKLPTVALRYFNVYGPRQALSNPYTGVVAIFAARLLNNKAPIVFEDGLQARDFTHVSDIVQANVLAMESENANYDVFNVGTGHSTSILEVADTLAQLLGKDVSPEILQKYRAGDVRHCYADIGKIQAKLGFHPRIEMKEGMGQLVEWLLSQSAIDRVSVAVSELEARGLAN